MKFWSFLSLATLLQIYSNVCGEDCMSVLQLISATRILCTQQRHNTILWQQVIDCHKPISDQFMRQSGEAQCPNPKYVEDPTNTDYTIQDVFFNICGLIDGNIFDQIGSGTCLLFGKSNPSTMSHSSEVAAVKATWGDNVPCNIGKCIMKLDLGMTQST